MIPNITRGSRPVGLMSYLVGPGRANEHTNPHLINGSATVMAWHDDAELDGAAARSIAREIDLNRRTYGFDESMQHIWHCSLAVRVDDRELTDQQWADIAQRFMDEMDFTDAGNKAPCQWVAVHHGRSKAGNDHIHIVASTVREDGTKWAVFPDYVKAQKSARGIERDYGLVQLGSFSERGLKPAELQKANGREATRVTLERTVRACAVAATDEAQFVRHLRRARLLVRARFAAGSDSVVTGYSVAQRPPKGSAPLWFGGGNLAKDLRLPSLRSRWDDTPESAQHAADEWMAARRGQKIVRPDPARAELSVETAARLAADLAQARRKLATVDVTDHQTWAHAAREVSGVYAAWAHATEDGSGPLGRTARALARSAHRSGMRIAEPIDPPLRMSGTAAFLLAVNRAPKPMAQAMILEQLVRTMGVIAQMHQATRELREAERVTSVVRDELAAVAAPLPDPPRVERNGQLLAHGGGLRTRGPIKEVDSSRVDASTVRQEHEKGMTL